MCTRSWRTSPVDMPEGGQDPRPSRNIYKESSASENCSPTAEQPYPLATWPGGSVCQGCPRRRSERRPAVRRSSGPTGGATGRTVVRPARLTDRQAGRPMDHPAGWEGSMCTSTATFHSLVGQGGSVSQWVDWSGRQAGHSVLLAGHRRPTAAAGCCVWWSLAARSGAAQWQWQDRRGCGGGDDRQITV